MLLFALGFWGSYLSKSIYEGYNLKHCTAVSSNNSNQYIDLALTKEENTFPVQIFSHVLTLAIDTA